MYEKNIIIKGKHAELTKKLVASFNSALSQGFFARNLDVYLLAPIVGKIYGRTGVVDNDSKDNTTSIHTEQMNKEMDQLELNYRLIMLLEDKNNLDIEIRTNRAFRFDRDPEKRKSGDEIFEGYVLGGIEILYEKLMNGTTDIDEYIVKLYSFITDFNMHYNKVIDNEQLYEMCKLSGF